MMSCVISARVIITGLSTLKGIYTVSGEITNSNLICLFSENALL